MEFIITTLRQIKIWIWLSSILPMVSLAGLFLVWQYFDNTFVSGLIISGEIIICTLAIVWWWWAMYTMRNLVRQWDKTNIKVSEVLDEIKGIRVSVREVFHTDDK